jgi:hypothetical protein
MQLDFGSYHGCKKLDIAVKMYINKVGGTGSAWEVLVPVGGGGGGKMVKEG